MRTLRRGIEALAPKLDGCLLDVGCGNRPFESLMANVKRTVGLEHPGAAMAYEESLKVSFARMRGIVDVLGDAAGLPFGDGVFDSCLCVEVLEHVPDPAVVAREIARVLRPGGRALVTVPFVGELHHVPYDYRRFTLYGIRQVLEGAGLEVEDVKSRGNVPIVAGAVAARAVYRFAASEIRSDGSISTRPWAFPFVAAACALLQGAALAAGSLSKDDGLCLGYVVLATRPRR